jgi:Domain of unknown function (DUF6438)
VGATFEAGLPARPLVKVRGEGLCLDDGQRESTNVADGAIRKGSRSDEIRPIIRPWPLPPLRPKRAASIGCRAMWRSKRGPAPRRARKSAYHVVFNTPHPKDLRSVSVTLKRTACFGTCPVYTVAVHGSGLVEYLGEFHVAMPGAQAGRVTAHGLSERRPKLKSKRSTEPRSSQLEGRRGMDGGVSRRAGSADLDRSLDPGVQSRSASPRSSKSHSARGLLEFCS